ncbi:hypothetical protein TIFTF001_033335 [Ficus carica]|uniref:Uncharacterized protein n=1 Tax=Ficus carica TaxID=3494 RepID=A0AA88J702_FICCA|nr:hypothetical protein TIFTF001_033335 [Ficus carica]
MNSYHLGNQARGEIGTTFGDPHIGGNTRSMCGKLKNPPFRGVMSLDQRTTKSPRHEQGHLARRGSDGEGLQEVASSLTHSLSISSSSSSSPSHFHLSRIFFFLRVADSSVPTRSLPWRRRLERGAARRSHTGSRRAPTHRPRRRPRS